jgi:hypothetical protein
VITWQAGLMPGRASSDVKPQSEKKPPPAEKPRVEPEPAPQQSAPVPPPGDAASADLDTIPRKPSPLAPRSDLAPSPVDEPEVTVKIPFARPHDVWVTTNPPGAKALLDDNIVEACQTPCMLHGSTGTHHVIVSQPGYRTETREIRIGDTAQDLPVITLRQPGGTLMLTTDPPGASVRVNGQLVQQTTPAQITLPPGNYSITVEKAGKSQSQRIEMQDSLMYLRIPLGQ